MRRELRTLQWSLAGVILLMILLCLWMIRMRRSLNNGKTASTSGTSVETSSVQSSPPESPVMSPRGEAATPSVRVSNAVQVPVSTNSEISTPRERDSHSASRDPGVVLPQKPSVVACFQRVSVNAVWIAVTTRSGLNGQDLLSRNFPSCNEWFRRGGQNCNDGKDDVSVCADGGSNVLSGLGCAFDSCG